MRIPHDIAPLFYPLFLSPFSKDPLYSTCYHSKLFRFLCLTFPFVAQYVDRPQGPSYSHIHLAGHSLVALGNFLTHHSKEKTLQTYLDNLTPTVSRSNTYCSGYHIYVNCSYNFPVAASQIPSRIFYFYNLKTSLQLSFPVLSRVGLDFAKFWGQTLVRNILFFLIGHDILLTKLGRTFLWDIPQRLARGKLRFCKISVSDSGTEYGARHFF